MGGDTADQALRKRERIEYIERMSEELSRMASDSRLPMLAYLLNMAAQEAAQSKAPEKLRLAPSDEPGRMPRARFEST